MINNDTERLRQSRLAPKVLKAKLSAKRMRGSCKYVDIMNFMILGKSIVCHNHQPGGPVTWQSIGLPFIENQLSKVPVCRGFCFQINAGFPRHPIFTVEVSQRKFRPGNDRTDAG